MNFDPISYNETRRARADIADLRAALPPLVLSSEQVYFTTSQTWEAPYDCVVRACLVGAGGGGGSYIQNGVPYYHGGGGGSGAIGIFRFKRINKGETLAVAIGAGGARAVQNGSSGNGGNTSLTGPWGTAVVGGGSGGGNATSSQNVDTVGTGGNGGSFSENCDVFWNGGKGGQGQMAAQNYGIANGGNLQFFGGSYALSDVPAYEWMGYLSKSVWGKGGGASAAGNGGGVIIDIYQLIKP